MTCLNIRPAEVGDAPTAVNVLRRSIETLCVADHGHDQAILDPWLRTKTADSMADWIAQDSGMILVAEADDRIVGVGGVRRTGEITLNYVAPEARQQGVSNALLQALETRARAWGCTRAWLSSTITARAFYAKRGYVDDGPPRSSFGGKLSYPMTRDL